MSPKGLRRLQTLLDRSLATASPAVRETFGHSDRRMRAAEFIEFWNSLRLVAVATVGRRGQPHIAPVHARFDGDRLVMSIYENATRRSDLQANPRIALTGWDRGRRVAIAYGRAREIPGSRRRTRPGSSGAPRHVVRMEIELTRIYALTGPPA